MKIIATIFTRKVKQSLNFFQPANDDCTSFRGLIKSEIVEKRHSKIGIALLNLLCLF